MRVTTCPNPYVYNYTDANEDLLAYKYPTFLFVYSAGNDQTSCPGGFNTTSKNLKNALIVAAVDQQGEMSSFSSFGPSKDGRLIPNISGDGVDVYSTFSITPTATWMAPLWPLLVLPELWLSFTSGIRNA
jgi:hypothetical protein